MIIANRFWSLQAARILAVCTVMAVTLCPRPAFAVPQNFHVQGRLTDANGVNRTGMFNVIFRIYPQLTGDTGLKWEESQQVQVVHGNFQAMLGQTPTPAFQGKTLADVFTGEPLYLEFQVSGEAPMVPRQALASVPYALRALAVESGGGSVRHYGGITTDCESPPTNFTIVSQNFYPPLTAGTTVVPIIEVFCAGNYSYAPGGNSSIAGFSQGPGTPFSPDARNPFPGVYTNMRVNDGINLQSHCNGSGVGHGNSKWMIVAVTEK